MENSLNKLELTFKEGIKIRLFFKRAKQAGPYVILIHLFPQINHFIS